MKNVFLMGMTLGLLGTFTSCGQNTSESSSLNSSIINGTETKPGEWANVVALTSRKSGGKFCSGTLITNKKVYSAAHCILTSNDVLDTLNYLKDKVETFASAEEKRAAIKRVVTFLIKNTTDDLTIEVDGVAKDIVESVKIDQKWEEFLFIAGYRQFKVATKEEIAFNEFNMRDRSEIILKEEVSVPLIKKITETEWNEILKNPYFPYKLTFVGYGFTRDPQEQSKVELDKNSYFGTKHSVETTMTHISKNDFTVYGGVNERSACMGDSGGAAFIKLASGELRYFASITAVARAKCGADIASRLQGEMGKLTLGSTKLDLRVDSL